MTKLPIYLDYMATTPIDAKVIPKMLDCMGFDSNFGNASSIQHIYGQKAATIIAESRETIAQTIGAEADEIIFTSGATESNNLAIIGAAKFYSRKGKHLITMQTEHKSCLAAFEKLEKDGYQVTYLKPMTNGLLDLEELKSTIRDDTVLVSIMHVNNEIGCIQNIHEIGNILSGKGIIFHVDAAQSAGRLPINLGELNVHLMSLSSHKNYGPKGIGALYIQQKPRVRIEAQTYGGGQEKGIRSGTMPTQQIAGMAEAFKISENLRETEQKRIKYLRDELWTGIKNLTHIKLNCDFAHSISGIINFSIEGVDGAALLEELNQLALSTMSACAVSSNTSSYVLKAIGISDELAKSAIRLCVGRFTTQEDIHKSIDIINKAYHKLSS